MPESEEKYRRLIRIPGVFHDFLGEILASCGGEKALQLGNEYFLLPACDWNLIRGSEAAKYIRWSLPVHHSWPCNPRKMEHFVEKAAQGISRKFAPQYPQTLLIGPLNPSSPDRYYKTLASNLRGRALQLFPEMPASTEVEAQTAEKPSLFCLVGAGGLFCGLSSPLEANGFYPGGTKFIRQGKESISRAGAKLSEALHYLRLHHTPLPSGSHWLELGACPGGMTAELLQRGYQVTAIDRAALDSRLDHVSGLQFFKTDVADFHPPARARYHAILSDMNGDALNSLRHVIRLSTHLQPGGIIIFTLKTLGTRTFGETNALFHKALSTIENAGFKLLAHTHLTYNRHEFTLFFTQI